MALMVFRKAGRFVAAFALQCDDASFPKPILAQMCRLANRSFRLSSESGRPPSAMMKNWAQ